MARSRVLNLANLQQFTAINLLSDPGHIPGKVKISNVAQIRLRWTLADGKTAYNVLHGRYTGSFAGTVAQMNSLFTGLVGGTPWTNFIALLHTTTTFAGVDVRDLGQVDQPIISSNVAGVPGTAVGSALPGEVAICVTLRTAKVGPANRGRAYLPGFATGSLAAGDVIAPATVTAVQTWAGTWSINFANNGYTLCIAQPARAGYPQPSPPQTHPPRDAGSIDVTQALVRDNHWDSQRRRGLR